MERYDDWRTADNSISDEEIEFRIREENPRFGDETSYRICLNCKHQYWSNAKMVYVCGKTNEMTYLTKPFCNKFEKKE